jgi:serine/threonine protein kinase
VEEPQILRELKRDVFGAVELLDGPQGKCVRRVTPARRMSLVTPLVRILAGVLMRRERRALHALEPVIGVPKLLAYEGYDRAGEVDPKTQGVLLRSFLEGVPLFMAQELPRDFFERLEELVHEIHARGVCHNDIHKEPNILVSPDGRPLVIDFQLASVHRRRGRTFRVRAAEDLRHVRKHRHVYESAAGVAPAGLDRRRPSLGAALWMRTGKPLYNLVTRRLLRIRKGEPRRPKGGPWPKWSDPIGPR